MDLFLIAARDGGGRRGNDPVDHRGDLRHRRDRHADPRRAVLYGIVLIIIGLLIGPGGVSIFC
jgi:hypothetical protein